MIIEKTNKIRFVFNAPEIKWLNRLQLLSIFILPVIIPSNAMDFRFFSLFTKTVAPICPMIANLLIVDERNCNLAMYAVVFVVGLIVSLTGLYCELINNKRLNITIGELNRSGKFFTIVCVFLFGWLVVMYLTSFVGEVTQSSLLMRLLKSDYIDRCIGSLFAMGYTHLLAVVVLLVCGYFKMKVFGGKE